jgi:hypothetical protein
MIDRANTNHMNEIFSHHDNTPGFTHGEVTPQFIIHKKLQTLPKNSRFCFKAKYYAQKARLTCWLLSSYYEPDEGDSIVLP